MIKDKELLRLKKQVENQKKIFGITDKKTGKDNPRFSYRFDARTRRLILQYRVPALTTSKGVSKIRSLRKSKYISQINEKNWKKYFNQNQSILKDHAKEILQEIEEVESTLNNFVDDYDFGWWKENFLSRKVGKTKSIKQLSPHTIKQNTNHLGQYYDWCINTHPESKEMGEHVDNGMEWFESFYQEKLTSGVWNGITCHTSFRNIRGFYNYVAERSKNKFPYDLLKRLNLKQPKTTREMVNSVELDKILDFIYTKKDDVMWGKFILMMRLQLKSGMRVGELVDIRNRNIDESVKCIWISGKTGRRKLNFSSPDDEIIWGDIIKKKGKGLYLFYRTKIVFYPKQRHKIEVDIDLDKSTTESYYLQRFREMRTLLGLRGKGVITSHSLRRYFITKFVKETKNRDLVRQIVGHSTTRMTDYYMGDMIEDDTKTTITLGV